MMEVNDAIGLLQSFAGDNLTRTVARIESGIQGTTIAGQPRLLAEHRAGHDVLAAAGVVKRLAGQINVVVHALGILLCLPKLLLPDEIIDYVSLGAGNTGRAFDLETSHRLAEFKFIRWQGGAEVIRQNALFKDFYQLAEYDSPKAKVLYVLGTEHPLKFFNGGRSLESVLSRNVGLRNELSSKYPGYRKVRDYYLPRREAVRIEDVSALLPGLSEELADATEYALPGGTEDS